MLILTHLSYKFLVNISHDGKKEQKDLSPVHSSQFSVTSNSETSEI
jgi:hypothetical protein